MKKRADESLIIFNRRFHCFYYSIPKDIKPPEVTTMLAYANAFDYKFSLWLRATKEPILETMQEEAFEIESNIMAIRRLKSEEQDEIVQAKNTQRPFKKDEQEGDGDCSHKDSEDEGTYDFVSKFSYMIRVLIILQLFQFHI